MIVLRTPKGWTGPKEVDGHKVEGFWRAHQVPLAGRAEEPDAFEAAGRVDAQLQARGVVRRRRHADRRELKALAPEGHAPHERQSARQRRAAAQGAAPARLPRLCGRGRQARARSTAENTASAGQFLRDVMRDEHDELPRLRPGREQPPTGSTRSTRSARRPGSPNTCPRTRTAASCRPTAGSWKCSASIRWKAGWRAIC